MKKRPCCFVCLILLMIRSILFVMAGGVSDLGMPASSVFREPEGTSVWIQGQVYKKSYTSNKQILYLKNNSVKDSKILIYDKQFTSVPIGKKIRLRGKTVLFERARNPGNYDSALYYAAKGFYGAIECEEIEYMWGKTNHLLNGLHDWKMEWKEKLLEVMGKKQGGILSAMLLGEKADMDADIKELYQKNGISHVLAISGLHISFLGFGVYRGMRKVGVPYFASGIVGILFLSMYVCMIGFTTSVLRAYIMLLLRIIADMTGRVYDMPTALSLAAAVNVFITPMCFADASFYLSYGAILGILFLLPALKGKRFAGFWTSVAVSITLLPVLLWYYFELSIYSVFLNLLVIPLMSAVIALGMAGSAMVFVAEPIGTAFLNICGLILSAFEKAGNLCMELPFAQQIFGKPEWYFVVLYYLLLGVGIFCMKRKKCLLFALLFLLLICRPRAQLQVTMLDVGQGDCIYLQGPKGKDYLIDGGSSDISEVGKYRIEPYLKSQGVRSLSYVFVSHGDGDHCSGIKELLERQKTGIQIECLVLPCNMWKDETLMELKQIAQRQGTKVVLAESGQSVREGEMEIRCLLPEPESNLTGNAGSMVLEISCGKFQMLSVGDIEGEGETELIRRCTRRQYSLLKVAHHGSKNSTTDAFLEAVDARLAWISSGKGNSYGHPHKETINRLEADGSRIFETQKTGAITLLVRGNSLTILKLPYRL